RGFEIRRGRARRTGSRGARVRASPARIVPLSSEEVSSEEVVSEPARAVFSRVLLKLSGESLMGEKEYGLDGERIDSVAGEIIESIRTRSSCQRSHTSRRSSEVSR